MLAIESQWQALQVNAKDKGYFKYNYTINSRGQEYKKGKKTLK